MKAEDMVAITAALRQAIEHAEDALVNLNLGVQARVGLDGKNTLAYTRKGTFWGLFIENGDGGKTPLSESGRQLLCAAVEKLDELHAAMLEEATCQFENMAAARVKAEYFVLKIRRPA